MQSGSGVSAARGRAARPIRVSVALCTCDGARYLLEQLESLSSQSRRPDEIVVADDASRDESPAIVRAWAARVAIPVRLEINTQRLGCTRNFEYAMSLCTGDVVFPCDQDDVWLPMKLETMTCPFEADPRVLLVHSDAQVVDAGLNVIAESLFGLLRIGAKERAAEDRGDALQVLTRRNIVTGASCAVRRELFERARPFDPGFVHDDWLALHAALLGRLVRIDRPAIKYRQHGRNQIGAPRGGNAMRLKQVWEGRARARASDLRRLEGLARRLHQLGMDGTPAHAAVHAALSLAQRRTALPAQRLRRVPRVLWWLANGDYFRNARGLRTAIGDLVEGRSRAAPGG